MALLWVWLWVVARCSLLGVVEAVWWETCNWSLNVEDCERRVRV